MPPSHEELKRWAQERWERNERIREGFLFIPSSEIERMRAKNG